MTPSGIKRLLEELREQHFQILMGLNNVRNEGIRSERGRLELEAVRELLLRHVQTEDGMFYPILEERSRNDAQMKLLLEAFTAYDMQDQLRVFFESVERNPDDALLAGSFNRLYADMKRRIEREENILFSEAGDE